MRVETNFTQYIKSSNATILFAHTLHTCSLSLSLYVVIEKSSTAIVFVTNQQMCGNYRTREYQTHSHPSSALISPTPRPPCTGRTPCAISKPFENATSAIFSRTLSPWPGAPQRIFASLESAYAQLWNSFHALLYMQQHRRQWWTSAVV